MPLAGWAAALVLTPLAVSRLAGKSAGLLAGLCLATSHAALNVAAEVRGYSWSAAFAALALYAIARDRERPERRWMIAYGLAGAAAVATVPVNLAAFATLAVLFVLLRWERDGVGVRVFAERRSWWFFLSPLAGLAVYVPVMGQLRDSLAQGSSGPFAALAREWPTATLWDYAWLAPFLVVGAWLAIRRRASWIGFAALAATVVVPVLITLPLSRKPIAYNFAPILPLVYASLGLALAPALEWLERWPRARVLILAMAAAGLIGLGHWREATGAGYWERARERPQIHNLYDQWFQVNNRVVDAVERVGELLRQPDTALVVGDCDPFSFYNYSYLLFPVEARDKPIALVGWNDGAEIDSKFLQIVRGRNSLLVIVAQSDADARDVVRRLGFEDRGEPVKIDDFGFYKIYGLP